jgi:ribonucleoside-triphosphate reductase
MCTLVETYPIKHDDLNDYLATLKFAYLYAKAVTLLPTHWPETNEIMQRNRRIGCSVSGVAQFAERHGWSTLKHWLNVSYEAVQARDVQYSEWLGVRESIKTIR